MSTLPGAEPFSADGGPVGVLLLHGFTGHPGSMRPWAEHLAAAGLTVTLPLLPGHGTRWEDLNATRWTDWYAAAEHELDRLASRCERVFVCGLSMGGTLTLRLAEQRAADIAGVVVVNPSLDTADKRSALLPVVSRFVPSLAGIGGDVKKPGVAEGGYDRTPLRAAASLRQFWSVVRKDLPAISAPVLAFRSSVDHVVPPTSLRLLQAGATGTTVTERVLTDSFHVATLDNDAPAIFAESLEFIHRHTPLTATAP